jgi:hypothetical protein
VKFIFFARAADWLPILNTLKINRTLEFIAVRSFFQLRIEDAGALCVSDGCGREVCYVIDCELSIELSELFSNNKLFSHQG